MQLARLLVTFVVLTVTNAFGASEIPPTEGGAPQMRRLSEEQYRTAIADIFGADIQVAGRFEPAYRKAGLLALGEAVVSVTPAGFEQYDTMARNIVTQVLDDQHRVKLLPCRPRSETEADDACTRRIVTHYGRLLFRRPLIEPEIARHVSVASQATAKLGTYWAGLRESLVSLIDSPDFIFRIEATEPDPTRPGQRRLTPYSKATRLSYLLWNSAPDAALLDAAAAGKLNTNKGLAAEVDRLMASKRLSDGVRAFFTDFLQLTEMDGLAKDPVVYPAYNQKVLDAAREQTLRTLTFLLLERKADYRQIFTSRQTFMTRPLGPVYWVPVHVRDGWEPFEFAANDPRAGIVTQVAFTALHSHPGRSSPTLRGKAVREVLLCQTVPPPPADVDFSIVQDTSNAQYKTARDRLTAHRTNPVCAGCHKVMDPIGLALENFDGLGQYRVQENGVIIDVSGEFSGKPFNDAASLGELLAADPAAPNCLASSFFRYGVGRDWHASEKKWRGWLQESFVKDGYQLPALIRRIATSDAFFRVSTQSNSEITKGANSYD